MQDTHTTSTDAQQTGGRSDAGTLRAAQVNPGWRWYRIDQEALTTALVEVYKDSTLVEVWHYGKNFIEPSSAYPGGVALSFVPVDADEFASLKSSIGVTRAFKHTLEQII